MKKYINIILVLLWMAFIFIMSSCNSGTSSYQSGLITNFITDLFNINNISLLSLIIRKLAHFTEYFILGVLVIDMFKHNNIKYLLLSLFICLIYAVSDEMHQLYIPGRSCQIIDILIDTIGSITGIFIYKLFNKNKLK